MEYPEVMNSGIEVRMWYCEEHKEYFSNNCSECMLRENEPEIEAQTRKEVGELLINAYDEAPTDDKFGWFHKFCADLI